MSRQLLYQRLSGLLRSFFGQHLPMHQGLSVNTIKAYRDSWTLLLRYGREVRGLGSADDWTVQLINRSLVLDFLSYLENERRVCVRTRNLRLAAICAFFHYLKGLQPELEIHCKQILAIPSKKARKHILGYLEADELQAVINSARSDSPQAHRDLALLVFSYNTGARAHEIAGARHSRVMTGSASYIRILGKGNKEREVPLWDGTLRLLDVYAKHRPKPRTSQETDFLFLSAQGRGLSRFAVSRIIGGHIRVAAEHRPALQKKKLTAHSMRHTTAVHLLQSGAELNIIRTWLGHASNESLQVYLGLDLTKKQDCLDHIITPDFAEACLRNLPAPDTDAFDLLAFLEKL